MWHDQILFHMLCGAFQGTLRINYLIWVTVRLYGSYTIWLWYLFHIEIDLNSIKNVFLSRVHRAPNMFTNSRSEQPEQAEQLILSEQSEHLEHLISSE